MKDYDIQGYDPEAYDRQFNSDISTVIKIVNGKDNPHFQRKRPYHRSSPDFFTANREILNARNSKAVRQQSRISSTHKTHSKGVKLSHPPKSYGSIRGVKKGKSFIKKLIIGTTIVTIVISGAVVISNLVKASKEKNSNPLPDTTTSSISNGPSFDESSREGYNGNQGHSNERYFRKNEEGIKMCKYYMGTDFGQYVCNISQQYGFDPKYEMAKFYRESWGFKHYDVLPEIYCTFDSPVPGDNGENYFNGTGYGLGQITIPEESRPVYAVDILEGYQDKEIINEENAIDPYMNVKLSVMIDQDNQDRLIEFLIKDYNEAIGIDVFNFEKVATVLNGGSIGLEGFDENRCVNQIMSALAFCELQCYNYGITTMLNEGINDIFDSKGNFLYDKLRENITKIHNSRYDYGDPNYIDDVLEFLGEDSFTNYIFMLGGYATFDLTNAPTEIFGGFRSEPIAELKERESSRVL